MIKLSEHLKISSSIYTSVLTAYETQKIKTNANNTNIVFRAARQELVQSTYYDILLLDVRYFAAFLSNLLHLQACL